MSGLLNFAQSASNAVAGNLGGPVDLISAALRFAGMPIPEAPIGSTEWMRRKGLIRDVEQGPARVLGETAGLLGPAMTAKFAPQIAGGLLQAGDNLAAPRTLPAEFGGIKVFRAGAEKGMTADKGGPTFYAASKEGAEPFLRNGPIREVEIDPKKVLDASRGEGIKVFQQFLKETNHPGGYGQTARPYWTTEYDLRNWLQKKGYEYDAIMFDEPTGVPSYAVYSKPQK